MEGGGKNSAPPKVQRETLFQKQTKRHIHNITIHVQHTQECEAEHTAMVLAQAWTEGKRGNDCTGKVTHTLMNSVNTNFTSFYYVNIFSCTFHINKVNKLTVTKMLEVMT